MKYEIVTQMKAML